MIGSMISRPSKPMRIADSLFDGIFVQRINRFLAEVTLRNGNVLAFIPNSGRLGELLVRGAPVKISGVGSHLNRKTSYDLIAVFHNGRWVSIDSRIPNKFIRHLVVQNSLPRHNNSRILKEEVRFSDSRFDFLLESKSGGRCYMEVKSCTLVVDGVAYFPDAPTSRGRKHLRDLVKVHDAGFMASIVFLIQRDDAYVFAPNRRTDPLFAIGLCDASDRGVEVLAFTCKVNNGEIELFREIPVVLDKRRG